MKRSLVFPILLTLLGFGQRYHAESRPLAIYWVDVGGGAATLIVTPQGESVLIDTGEDLSRDASRIHYVASQIAGLKHIDHVVITHWHSDHFGGAYRLSQLMPLRQFYANRNIPEVAPDPAYPAQVPVIAKSLAQFKSIAGKKCRTLTPGEQLRLRQSGSPAIEIQCLAGDKKVISAANAPANPVCSKRTVRPDDPTDNARSLVLRLKYGSFSFLVTGDLTWNAEEHVVCPKNSIGHVDIFQIGHHGLDQSNNPVLIESISPRVVIINNAQKKGAEPNTMKTLKSTKSIEAIWQIHRNIQTGDDLNTPPRFIANAEENDKKIKMEFIKATIQPDGKYSVQIGTNGYSQTYQSR
jgi:beta-lactamase superfamily II metal-dependent hydrolase